MKLIILGILERVKVLTKDLNLDDEYLKIYCEQAYYESCGICNLKEMPEESINSISFLCVSNLVAENSNNIQSLSEGGRSVSFGNMTSQEMREKALQGLERWKKIRCV